MLWVGEICTHYNIHVHTTYITRIVYVHDAPCVCVISSMSDKARSLPLEQALR